MASPTKTGKAGGFTILELLVVMAIIGTLLSLAVPRYYNSVDKTREAVLRENLKTLRSTLDRYQADTGAYPATLQELVERRYLRSIPEDPLTGSDATWQPIAEGAGKPGVADVRSGAGGHGLDGRPYREW